MVERLGRRVQFDHLRAQGTTVREGGLRIVRAPAIPGVGPDKAAVAFAISRRFGTAVQRNRVRRRLRAVLDTTERGGTLRSGWYLVTVLPTSREPSSEELTQWVQRAVARLEEQGGGTG